MSSTTSTSSIDNQEIFSVGVLPKNYTKPYNPIQSEIKELKFGSSIHPFKVKLVDDQPTSISSETSRLDQLISQDCTSDVPTVRNKDFPIEVKINFAKLNTTEDEDILYEIADKIAEWLIDNSDEYQSVLSLYIKNMPSESIRILISAFSDAELTINNQYLLYQIGSFVKSSEKRLAQSAAACLLTSGGNLGRKILGDMLEHENLPHRQLIQGISKLLS